MVRHSVSRWLVALLAFGWAWPSATDAIASTTSGTATPTGTEVSPLFVTGNVATDMPAPAAGTSNGITVIPGQAFNSVYQPPGWTAAGLVNGYAIQDIRLSYNAATDTLSVGVNFYGVAGQLVTATNGATTAASEAAAGNNNPPNIGGDKSITIALTPVAAGGGAAADPVVVAGVPANKVGSPVGSLDGFNVATVNLNNIGPNGSNIQNAYGTTLTANLGALAYDPSQAHPGFEFTIKNFSKIPGLNALTNGFYVSAYAGTGTTYLVGKSAVADTFVGAPLVKEPQDLNTPNPITTATPAVRTPEPTTVLAWGLVAGGAGWRFRRRLRPSLPS
jgi:hypothetical protein